MRLCGVAVAAAVSGDVDVCAAAVTVSGMASRKREKLPDWPKDMGGLDLARKKAKNQDEEEHELVLTILRPEGCKITLASKAQAAASIRSKLIGQARY